MRFTFALLILAGIVFTLSPARAQLTWHQNPLNGHWYALTPNVMTWTQAQTFAAQAGGHLATVRNHMEEEWIVKTFTTTPSANLWIGFTDAGHEGTWTWEDGEPAPKQSPGSFTAWCPGEPNNSGGNENWAFMNDVGGTACSGRWVDAPATSTFRGLVELGLYFAFGSGCPGSQGIPALLPGQAPRLGRPFSLHLMNLPLGQPGFLFIGRSKTRWGLLPLPYDMTPFGLTGCTLYSSGEIILGIASNSYGAITWGLTFPNSVSLLGSSIYNQALFVDAGANPYGLISTNGGEGRVEQAPAGT